MQRLNSKNIEQDSHTLLVIDDNEGITDIIAEVGRELKFKVACINDYERIRQVYREVNPEYIILDLDLGMDKDIEMAERGYDGLDILQFLSAQECKAQIVIISGSDKDKRDVTTRIGRELKLNVRGSLAKPFEVAHIERVLLKLKRS